MADLTPIPMGIPWDPWDPSLPHSHAHLYSVPVPVPIPSVVTSRPTTASRPSCPHNPSLLAPQIRLLLTTVRVYKLYLLTYLHRLYNTATLTSGFDYQRGDSY